MTDTTAANGPSVYGLRARRIERALNTPRRHATLHTSRAPAADDNASDMAHDLQRCYLPLDTLKPIAEDAWIVDGPVPASPGLTW